MIVRTLYGHWRNVKNDGIRKKEIKKTQSHQIQVKVKLILYFFLSFLIERAIGVVRTFPITIFFAS